MLEDCISNESDWFTVYHFNVTSLGTGFDIFSDYFTENHCSVIAAWLAPDIPYSFYLPGYELVRADRVTRGDGVGLYVASELSFKLINVNCFQNSELEQAWITAEIGRQKIAIGNVYKPPVLPVRVFDELESVLESVSVSADHIALTGDVNIDFLTQKP